MRYRDREHAGQELAKALRHLREGDVLVLGIPRGGVPVAAEVARALGAELDVIVAKKVGAPWQEELAVAAVTADGTTVFHAEALDQLQLGADWLREAIEGKRREAEEREARMRAGRPALRVEARTVVLVDDGLATGSTALACLRALRAAHPKRLILAVPVGAASTCELFEQEVDELVCLARPERFFAVGAHYEQFDPVSEARVQELLTRPTHRT
jgi:putative phosphoribosyl transferase